ncbi:hypothetical protein AVEN_7175-1 [Araneus ventricosus]|uniref:Uncharacterized protein n=1 Tax=Araneus ventricosus TaxID=182803 RepID=A0A4Y2GU37_ARAVE|nr:hypothetical protein AVEN_7175-1 [Araneus ventricosus]
MTHKQHRLENNLTTNRTFMECSAYNQFVEKKIVRPSSSLRLRFLTMHSLAHTSTNIQNETLAALKLNGKEEKGSGLRIKSIYPFAPPSLMEWSSSLSESLCSSSSAISYQDRVARPCPQHG